ncbi:NUDIX hydrolase [Streptomyces eurythermus]|jgi:8-oxo-dGTP pyrophosphatase MutT (NUDIX family)|uniref:NUDIX hydrolase n=1 Tax=Streptomyces eurythermus TaxID=42237 RepID=UPI0033EA0A13
MHKDTDFKNPPRRRIGALAVIRDGEESVLLVKKAYKEGKNWGLPGGAAHADEAPHDTWTREIREETGLDRAPGRLLVVDYVSYSEASGAAEGINLVFDGGTVSDTEIQLPEHEGEGAEITDFQFVPLYRLSDFVTPLTEKRIRSAVAVLEDNSSSAYLAEGCPQR